jgi:hypothetical protein
MSMNNVFWGIEVQPTKMSNKSYVMFFSVTKLQLLENIKYFLTRKNRPSKLRQKIMSRKVMVFWVAKA